MTERRYSEDEVARIIEAAARDAGRPGGPSDPAGGGSPGLSLAELQEIGAEVGIPAHAIAASAAALDVGGAPVSITDTTLGVPHGVAGTIPLPRDLTDREWGILVGRVRETFQAHGKTESEGPIRSWRNGNLLVAIEPSPAGTVLRMRTHKADARALPQLGLTFGAFGALFCGAMTLLGEPRLAVVMAVAFIPLLLTVLYQGTVNLPRWGRTRQGQMEELAAFVLEMTSRPAPEVGPSRPPRPLPEG